MANRSLRAKQNSGNAVEPGSESEMFLKVRYWSGIGNADWEGQRNAMFFLGLRKGVGKHLRTGTTGHRSGFARFSFLWRFDGGFGRFRCLRDYLDVL